MFDINNITDVDMQSSLQKTITIQNMSASIVEKDTTNIVLGEIHREINGKSQSDTLVATCALLQKGGTSRGMNSNSTVTIGDSKVSKGILHKACSNHKITPRQLARTLSSHIANVSELLDIPGNQSKNYKAEYPNATKEDLIWVSDFQTFNENCPAHIRSWLIKNYQERFKKNPQTIIN